MTYRKGRVNTFFACRDRATVHKGVMSKERRTYRISDEEYQAAKDALEGTGRTVSDVIRDALRTVVAASQEERP